LGASPSGSNYQQKIPAELVTSINCVSDSGPPHVLLELKHTWALFGIPQIATAAETFREPHRILGCIHTKKVGLLL